MLRVSLASLFILALSLLLAACGDSTTVTSGTVTTATTSGVTTTVATGPTTAATSGTTTTTTAGAVNLSFTDRSGYTATLPKPAQRVVCMWTDCLDILKEIGLEPIAIDGAVYNVVAAAPYPLVDKNKPVEKIGGTFAEPNIEDILRLKPDLVIGLETTHARLRDVLKDSVPLYLLYGQSYDQMIANLKTIGRLTGRSAEADQAAQKFLDKLAAYKAKAPQNKTILFTNTNDGASFFVYSENNIGCQVLNQLAKCAWSSTPGIKVDARTGGLTFTLEQLLAADPQVLVTYYYPGIPKTTELMKDNKLWQELSAVKNRQVIEVNAAVTQPGGTYGLTVMLDTIMPLVYPDVFPKALP